MTTPDSRHERAAARIAVDSVAKVFQGDHGGTTVFSGLDLVIEAGSFVSLVGPSGCGKSTLLRIIAGLTAPSSGTVTVAGQQVRGPLPGTSVVFQDYSASLFPWMTVTRNIELGARWISERGARAAAVASLLDDVGLGPAAGAKHPWQLSGGMQQRVAIARALASRPRVLLLDEPFAAVDAQTRSDLQDLIRALWQEHRMTVVLVTHDIDEAVYTSDRVIALGAQAAGVVLDTPIELSGDRDQLITRAEPGFAAARSQVLSTIRRPAGPQPPSELNGHRSPQEILR